MAFYGPMSDVVATAWPAVVRWLYDHGRYAVQLFLVCAGFLTANHLARLESLALKDAFKLVGNRYLRLAIPLLAALSFTVLITEWVRPDFDHASLSATPDWGQALAHMLLLQHLLDMEALSAGIWYVAIDFQLYAMTLLSLWVVSLCRSAQARYSVRAMRLVLWCLLTCASWWWWNLDTALDDHGVYFFGAYGLGLLAWEARSWLSHNAPTAQQKWALWLGLLLLWGVAWWLGPRGRMAVAFGITALLVAAPVRWFLGDALSQSPWRRGVAWLSGVSYSVFLMHFGVSLAISAWITWAWPDVLWANAMGMLLALLVSLGFGGMLYRFVERQAPTWWHWWLWAGFFKASVALTVLTNPVG
ncbi:acyltransferase [Limnohabitans sp. G3-2]|uniref:acyltransferase family protein n=1 Tax=Limnohabitans sp. G3-2 TaxID=1100711 RepID=UPI001E44A130|nr:acyltransferase family protein [Limnohabitans sp. G3-2]